MTQLGRIEAALNGVLLNTDFIDNSAGVDTSDHEVNIKILLNGEVQKKLTLEQRNKLLAAMTDEVEQLVLNDNYRQNQAISLMERMGMSARLQAALHPHAGIAGPARPPDRIPAPDAESPSARRAAGPDPAGAGGAAVLLKLVAVPAAVDSDVPEMPYLSQELQRYFPELLQKKYA